MTEPAAAAVPQPPPGALDRTVLHGAHLRLGARIVPFAGYEMPVQYPSGILKEHQWTREHAGLFDVSHMGPAWLAAESHAAAAALIEPLVCGDIAALKPGQLRYTLLLNGQGGTLDDLMVGRDPDREGRLYIIVNAGTKEADFDRIGPARLTRADDGALLALQGPEAAAVLEAVLPGVSGLSFMSFARFAWEGAELVVSRSGYTGEDGFEALVPALAAERFWDRLVGDERVRPVGLGARDSLRLEAGLPLYGHDLDETVSPIEAGLAFAVSRRRRDAADFPGAGRILDELAKGPGRIRAGLKVEGAPAREGAEVLDQSGAAVGRVTSGGFSPSLGHPIALAFVRPDCAAAGTRLAAVVRGKAQPAEVVDLPFVPHRYVRKP
jgi:aminomethyltransferase